MFKRLHWTILRALPLPFVAAFGTLMFLLLMQFLMKYLPQLVGRGLPFWVLVELVAYSLAYMVTLAVPMAWLIAQLAVFGRLSENRAYLVLKAAGISLPQIAWPVLVAGALLTWGMSYFNHVMLPEANYRMNGLWRDIQVSRPGFALEPGVFYTGLDGYAIRAESIPADSSGLLEGVTVIETQGRNGVQAVLTAERARLQTQAGGQRLTMLLEGGEVHQRQAGVAETERYERLAFTRHRLAFDLSDLSFERRDASSISRSDRSMLTVEMRARKDSLVAAGAGRADSVRATVLRLGRPLAHADEPVAGASIPLFPVAGEPALAAEPRPDLFAEGATTPYDSLSPEARLAVVDLATARAQMVRGQAEAAASQLRWERQRADRYRVEIYKKQAIAGACLVFVLIGVPLGLGVARAGLGRTATAAVGIFLFYWVTLVQGEKLADREFIPPWLGMWTATAVVTLLGLVLALREARSPTGLGVRLRREPSPAPPPRPEASPAPSAPSAEALAPASSQALS